ncbi:protein ARV1-like [Patiria miniata]|uniref:Protein ARV n=1 Tax=Patiria miniata TaxID=46514 RepID=A0A914B841_PATMI|nr:protein ARV1-like [Patiria miniata]
MLTWKSKMSAPMGSEEKLVESNMKSKTTCTTHTNLNRYLCIECGTYATALYKIYSGGVIKIAHCENCSKVVDKYVEFDPVIILLDALLYKPQAYRHILFNTNSNIHWKLSILCLLCDAYTKWAQRSRLNSASDLLDRQFLFFALQWHFYVMFIIAGLELSTFLIGVVASTILHRKITGSPGICTSLLLRSLLLCCVGKLLVIPMVIWGTTDIETCMWLTRLFVFTSATQALRVIMNSHTALASSLILLGFSAQYLSTHLSPLLEWVLMQSFAS